MKKVILKMLIGPSIKEYKKNIFYHFFDVNSNHGRRVDLFLSVLIVLSVSSVLLESVKELRTIYHYYFSSLEWILTIIFTIEYLLRIMTTPHSKKYAFSMMGMIDLLAIVPSYLSLFITSSHSLIFVRVIRLMRVFRILKLRRHIKAAESLELAIQASLPKITVFFGSLIILILCLGTIMYLIEGEENGFTSIPKSIYWAVVTITTVGYGDLVPKTSLGQTLSAFIMILGYSIIAVPTGIISAELAQSTMKKTEPSETICDNCSKKSHEIRSRYCYHCGFSLAK